MADSPSTGWRGVYREMGVPVESPDDPAKTGEGSGAGVPRILGRSDEDHPAPSQAEL